MSKKIANRFPDDKETINTVDTGLKVLCPYCGERNASFEGGIDIDEYTGEMECNYCDNNFYVEFDVTVNFSTFKIEANNE